MTDKNTGGPAFPCDIATRYQGASLRDYFAAKAMQAMAAAPMGKFAHGKFKELADSAYAMADRMMEARDK